MASDPLANLHIALRGVKVKAKSYASGVNGNRIVTTTISRVAINRYFPGLLLKKDLRVRITLG